MEEEFVDIKTLLYIRKVYNKFLNEKNNNENISSANAIFADAINKRDFYSQQELTDFIGCDKAHTSRTMLKMQLIGLVKPICRSKEKFALTEKGKAFAIQVSRRKKQMIEELFFNISQTEIDTFLNVMHKIIANAKVIDGN